MYIIVGLGNPGNEYENTNHNIGFSVVDLLLQKTGKSLRKKGCKSLLTEFFVNGNKIVVAKPQTYMNNSGDAVVELVNKYKANPETELVVVVDDYGIEEGTIRIRKETSATTHNGIKSIMNRLKTNKFIKIKVSIGKKPEFMDTASFVLSKIKNQKTLEARDKASFALYDLIFGKTVEQISNLYN